MCRTVWIHSCNFKFNRWCLTEVWSYHKDVTATEGYIKRCTHKCKFSFSDLLYWNVMMGIYGREIAMWRKWRISNCQLANFREHCSSHAYMMSYIIVSLKTKEALIKNTEHFAAIAQYSLQNHSEHCINKNKWRAIKYRRLKKKTISWIFRHLVAPCNYVRHSNFQLP